MKRIALILTLALSAPAHSQPVAGKEYTHPIGYEIWAPKEVKGSKTESYRLWIPDKVQKVRGVIVVPDYASDRIIYFSEDLGYRQFAERMDFALLAYRVFNEDTDATRDEATKDMLLALESLGAKSGHAELAFASLISTGMSWGARCAMAIAMSVPERTIGFVPLHCTLTFAEISASAHREAFFKVPGLCETVEFEKYYDKTKPPFEATDTGLAVHASNAQGALHASYIFPGANHPDVREHEFIWLWITCITGQRLPSKLTFDKAPELNPIIRESGWIGTYDYEHRWNAEEKFEHFRVKSVNITPFADFKGDPAKANWLPNEALARAWKAKMKY
jgi:dienelactone hydrolase